MPVYGQDGLPMTASQLKQQFEDVVNMGSTPGQPVGLFTMEHRDRWAQAYKKMVTGNYQINLVITQTCVFFTPQL